MRWDEKRRSLPLKKNARRHYQRVENKDWGWKVNIKSYQL